jgi:hypothetical protein
MGISLGIRLVCGKTPLFSLFWRFLSIVSFYELEKP